MNLDEYYKSSNVSQIWTDIDMIKAFIVGLIIGSFVTWML